MDSIITCFGTHEKEVTFFEYKGEEGEELWT
jgi:hypothetical protein